MTYQLIQQSDLSANILCPICQHHVVDWTQEQYIQPCEHTLFIAMDLGFEFVTDRFEANMLQSVDELHEDDEMNIFQAITTTPYLQLTIIQTDLGVQNLFRYIGFSPVS
ncbi:hypothetical protein QE380_000559 [Acinetobacter baylyi]|uniref:Uncharacterized protein n=1 Tax=Acinetobacter baylyi TaxID=202950 RepID=A0ABU0USW6_ACIBI|nr:hypothetical protein [Acinetobacter baylyi]MDQ1207636.1 hypothetical protein [Acinetobacter baylyi]MDR6105287.1 hypothetical protein [Acinetobacter baylyi]MDR6184507.1 hypothetical protein [Acinetobacter baylyi]